MLNFHTLKIIFLCLYRPGLLLMILKIIITVIYCHFSFFRKMYLFYVYLCVLCAYQRRETYNMELQL